MLKLINVCKDYPLKDQPTVHALKNVSLNFPKSQFVAILGPSGCGKTTLLNITGGLDRYGKGDLIIKGKSTKDFKDRDWDTYRNHSIGFVFQTYNLVAHLSVLGNVELALSIAGYKKETRRLKAMKALDEVGLKGLYKKRPNQLSGGQMQRVAIARALVNDPEILLADEPTGALDSETSLSIMDLLKEVAKDRLVVMVTHNAELANRYANRIIHLKDGEVTGDSLPLNDDDEARDWEKSQENIPALSTDSNKPNKKAKMDLWTSMTLSARNLWAKFKRTSLVCIAGSIGIIGISTVLALSNGVKSYIKDMQDDMLSGNPIAIEKQALNMANLMNSFSQTAKEEALKKASKDGKINVDFMVEYLTKQKDNLETYMVNNDINEDYLSFVDAMPKEYYAAMEKNYGINYKMNIFTDVDLTAENGSEKRTLSLKTLESMYVEIVKNTSFKEYASVINLLTDVIFSCPDSPEYILSQYDLLEGTIAEKEDEMMLVVSPDRELTDIFLGQLGYYSQDQFVDLVNYFAQPEKERENNPEKMKEKFNIPDVFDIKNKEKTGLLDKTFVYEPYEAGYVFKDNGENNNPLFTFNKTGSPFDIPYTYQGEATSLTDLTNNHSGKTIKITGVLTAKKGVQYGCLKTGFVVSPKMSQMVLKDAEKSGINKTLQNCFEKTYSAPPETLTPEKQSLWKQN